MEKEFKSLSEKTKMLHGETHYPYPRNVYWEEDIKEFIERLKEKMCRCRTMVGEGKKCYACRNIDKLAGDKLITK